MSKLTMADMKEFGNEKTVKLKQAKKRISREEINDLDEDTRYLAKSQQVDEEIDFDHAPIAKYFDRVA